MGSIGLCGAQDISSASTDLADFDINTAMTDVQELKTDLDDVIQQLYSLDEQER